MRAGEKILSGTKTKALMFAALSLSLIVYGAEASEPENTLRVSNAVMAAYQKAYAMNFEIWKPSDLPAGWYATFDGYPVAQIAENRWVYGQFGTDGAISPTNVLVGSVIPSNVPGLARVASALAFGKSFSSPEFQKIAEYRVNRMGWLNENGVSTIIAWHTDIPGVYVWLGNRWKRLEPRQGEYTWQMLKRLTPWILSELRKNNALYQGGEPIEAADMARQWGYIWSGKVILQSLKAYKDTGGSERGNVTSIRDTSSSGSTGSSSPKETVRQETGARWDVD